MLTNNSNPTPKPSINETLELARPLPSPSPHPTAPGDLAEEATLLHEECCGDAKAASAALAVTARSRAPDAPTGYSKVARLASFKGLRSLCRVPYSS